MAITWLSSYPKSGNTWVRFMIANMLAGPLDSTEHLQGIVPDMHDPLDNSHGQRWMSLPRQVMKTHLVYRDADPFQGRTERVIAIVRNPLDVLASSLNFRLLAERKKHGEIGDEAAVRGEYVDSFLGAGGAPEWIGVGFGSWPEHVRSWERASGVFPVLRLRYEDMLADPVGHGRRVRDFLGLGIDDAASDAAVEASGFGRMREIEQREVAERRPGFFQQWHGNDGSTEGAWFTNRGTSGGGRVVLTEEEIERAKDVFGEEMSALGYDVG